MYLVQEKTSIGWKTIGRFDDEYDALVFILEYGTRGIRLLEDGLEIPLNWKLVQ